MYFPQSIKSIFWVGISSLLFLGCSSGTAAPTTLAPTTTVLTKYDLNQQQVETLIPSITDLPPGWTMTGTLSSPTSSPLVAEYGDGKGNCGGGNNAARLTTNNVAAWVLSPNIKTDKSDGNVHIFHFPTESQATSYFDATVASVACGYNEYTAVELADGETEKATSKTPRVDIFAGPDKSTKWTVRVNYSVGGALEGGSKTGATFTEDTEHLATRQGTSFGTTSRDVFGLERFKNIVIRWSLSGDCCVYGFSNSKSREVDERPTLNELASFAGSFRQAILEKLKNPSASPSSSSDT
jgi:hypothetical protein